MCVCVCVWIRTNVDGLATGPAEGLRDLDVDGELHAVCVCVYMFPSEWVSKEER